MNTLRLSGYSLLLIITSTLFVHNAAPLFAQDEAGSYGVAAEPASPTGLSGEELKLVQVDWFDEMLEGGITMVALGLVSVALLTFIAERAVRMRASNLVPPGMLKKLLPLFADRQYDKIRAMNQKRPSAIGDIAVFLVDHRKADPQLLITAAGDLGAREIARQERMCQPFSVIAGIAPLLGLLGTMIGMIESFKLVEVFGDEGGASLLAGSISKALITTAVGLVLAIPALIAYHAFKSRAQTIGTILEEATEQLFNSWFLSNPKLPAVGVVPLHPAPPAHSPKQAAPRRRSKPTASNIPAPAPQPE